MKLYQRKAEEFVIFIDFHICLGNMVVFLVKNVYNYFREQGNIVLSLYAKINIILWRTVCGV